MNPKQALWPVRIIWLALVVSVAVMAGVFAFLIRGGASPAQIDPQVVTILFYASIAVAAAGIPLGLFLRGQMFKAGWVGNVVQPGAYLTGNIIAWALSEVAAMFSIIVSFLAGTF
jgi:Flp pilus assembly protein CpaB